VIIAVSDVHLGHQDEGKQERFLEFLNKCDTEEIDHLVLLGDIFDFWRRSNGLIFYCDGRKKADPREQANLERLVNTNCEILAKLSQLKVKNLHYVVGNHDYYIHRLQKRNSKTYQFPVHKTLRLKDDDNWYFFTHGYDMDVYATMESLMSIDQYEKLSESLCFLTDKSGWLADRLWGLTEKIQDLKNRIGVMQRPPAERKEEVDLIQQFAESRAAQLFLGMHPMDSLIYGHTHVPASKKMTCGAYVANTGCWSGDDQGWYIKISGDTVEALNFHGESIV
jgi:UDP-2,3-diacylglucosamine pyrophosphatase LpxH